MGTNYYAVKRKPSISEPIHIGKSSAGWLFCFQDQRDTWRDIPVEWHTYEQVMNWLEKYTTGRNSPYVILDEYDRVVSLKEFKKLVDDKQTDPRNLENPDNFQYSRNVNGYRFSEGDFS